MLHVMPSQYQAMQPGCMFPPGHGPAAAAGLGAAQEGCLGNSQWGTQTEQARAGSQSGAVTPWSVWVGHVSLVLRVTQPCLGSQDMSSTHTPALTPRCPSHTEQRRGGNRVCFLFVSQQRGCCAGQEGVPVLFPGCSEAGADGRVSACPSLSSFQVL